MRKEFYRRLVVPVVLAVLLSGCASTGQAYSDTPVGGTTVSPTVLLEDVPLLCQYPEFPTGCEATAAVMALQAIGTEVSVSEFCGEWLEKDAAFWRDSEGHLHGPDPYEVYVGEPTVRQSYGCFLPVISRAVRRHCDTAEVHNLTGWSVKGLCREYLDKGIPVVMWISMDMREISDGQSWITPSGESFTWPAGEHCALLVGYSDTQLFFHDPMYTERMTYDRAVVEARYKQLGQQALAFVSTSKTEPDDNPIEN